MSETSLVREYVARYCCGRGVDVGCGDDKITPDAVGLDFARAYDLPDHPITSADVRGPWEEYFSSVPDGTLDYVYSSHLLEDYNDVEPALREWHRALRHGGCLVLCLPIEDTFRRHCEATGQPGNPRHRQNWTGANDFLERLPTWLREDTACVEGSELPDTYSFYVVLRKGHVADHRTGRPDPVIPRHIILFDPEIALTQEQMTQLRDVGAQTLQVWMPWEDVEPQRGQYAWDAYDRYVEMAGDVGVHLLLRLPYAAPDWAPLDWFFASRHASNANGTRPNRFASIWSNDATAHTEAFIRDACGRYHGDAVTCCSCIGLWGETWFPVRMGNDYYSSRSNARSMWCFDPHAVHDFRRAMRHKYDTVAEYNLANGTAFISWEHVMPADFRDNPLGIADTIEWYNASAESYHRRIQEAFLASTGASEVWMGNVPRHGFHHSHIDAGMFRCEEWIDRLSADLRRRAVDLNQLWYSIFLTDRDTLAFHYWLLRHYDWNVWVGAEGASNIVANSRRARSAGCRGVVVGNPFGGRYGGVEVSQALTNIADAADLWRDT